MVEYCKSNCLIMKLILALTLVCIGHMLEASPPSPPPPAERDGGFSSPPPLISERDDASHTVPEDDDSYTYEDHIKRFDLHHSAEEEPARRANFAKVDAIIKKHNADPSRTSKLGHNHLSTATESEKKVLRGYIVPKDGIAKSREIVEEEVEDRSLPSSKDWHAEGYLSPIVNQGSCGSCWTFSASATLESRWAIVNGKPVPKLSEQNLVDCVHTGNSNNDGCKGGCFTDAWDYTASKVRGAVGTMTMKNGATLPKSVKGQDCEADYPYTGKGGQSCQFKSKNVGAYATGYNIGVHMYYTNSLYYTESASHSVTRKSPTAMIKALQTGPVSVAIDASGYQFNHYESGTLQADNCKTNLDHAVNIVGYGSDSNGKFWLLRNSWGAGWGDKGYIKFARTDATGPGTCGVLLQGAYPNVVRGTSGALSGSKCAPVTKPCKCGCADKYKSNCPTWAAAGDCSNEYGAWMKKVCSKSCGCVGYCKDKKTSCPNYEKAGYCKKTYVSWMKKNCPKSCSCKNPGVFG